MTEDKFHKIVLYLKDLIKGTKFEGKTYVVGGAVRDLLMNKEIKDVDIVVEFPNGGIEIDYYGEVISDYNEWSKEREEYIENLYKELKNGEE